jgi:phosphoglycolate phosphatase
MTFSKPHPAMLLEIMEELDVLPERTLMVGDTTHDLQMAINAGVDAIGVTHGAHPEDQLRSLNPLALLDDFSELRDWLRTNA